MNSKENLMTTKFACMELISNLCKLESDYLTPTSFAQNATKFNLVYRNPNKAINFTIAEIEILEAGRFIVAFNQHERLKETQYLARKYEASRLADTPIHQNRRFYALNPDGAPLTPVELEDLKANTNALLALFTKRAKKANDFSSVMNMSDALVTMLGEIGITTLEGLKKIGAEGVFAEIQKRYPNKANTNPYIKARIHGAITGQHYLILHGMLKDKEKVELEN